MKYYAVTEDPRELYHYGVKGMKWGQHIFGDKPKSPGYHKALSKLRAGAKAVGKGVSKVSSGIAKTATQAAYNHRARQQRRYEKAVAKAQKRTNLTSALHDLDKEESLRKQVDTERKYEALQEKSRQIQAHNDYKALKKGVRLEKHMPKYMQEARTGELKYGKLTEDQISRVQSRLALEANTRRLGSTEEPSWRAQKKAARRAGYLSGIQKGISAGMEEVARAGVQYGIKNLANRRKMDKKSELEAEREKNRNRIKNDKTRSEMRKDLKRETYEAQIKAGLGPLARSPLASAKLTSERLETAQRMLQGRQLALEDKAEAHRFRRQENQKALQSFRQNSENAFREARTRESEQKAREEIIRFIGEHGFDPRILGSSGGKNGGGGKGNISKDEMQKIKEYYLNTQNGTNASIVEAEQRAQEAERRAQEAEERERRKAEEREKRKAEQKRKQEMQEYRSWQAHQRDRAETEPYNYRDSMPYGFSTARFRSDPDEPYPFVGLGPRSNFSTKNRKKSANRRSAWS